MGSLLRLPAGRLKGRKEKFMLNVVLYEPEIASNTGNIGRTCAAAGARLHLIEPLGFHLTDRNLRRAGMDYWNNLDVVRYIDYEDFLEKNPGADLYFASSKGKRVYTEIAYPRDCYLMFGKESTGLPEELLLQHRERSVRIPMAEGARALNLANAAAVVIYEALRQNGFPGLKLKGKLAGAEDSA